MHHLNQNRMKVAHCIERGGDIGFIAFGLLGDVSADWFLVPQAAFSSAE
ncbi:MAG: hypothetical protein ACKVJU_14570 [Verrucomicrobiales bacterium]